MQNLTLDQKQVLAGQIEKTVTEMGLVPEGYRLIVRIERVPNRRDPAPEGHRSAEHLATLLGRDLMRVYEDPTLGVRLVDRNRYSQRIQDVINHPPPEIDGEITTLRGFANNLTILRATRMHEDLYLHIRLWFDRLEVPYAQIPSLSYAEVHNG